MAAQDRQSKRSVVLKTFSKARMSSSLRARLENEVKHLRALAGVPGVVHMLSQTEDEDSIYIVLERVTGGSLLEIHLGSPIFMLYPDCSLLQMLRRFSKEHPAFGVAFFPCSPALYPTQATGLEPPHSSPRLALPALPVPQAAR